MTKTMAGYRIWTYRCFYVDGTAIEEQIIARPVMAFALRKALGRALQFVQGDRLAIERIEILEAVVWEAIEHRNSQTIFRGNAEGRTCYAVTTDRYGMSVCPSGCRVVYSLTEARKQAAEDLDRVPWGC